MIPVEGIRNRATLSTHSMTTEEVRTTHRSSTRPVLIRRRKAKEVRENFGLLGEAFGHPQRYYTAKRMGTASLPTDATYKDAPGRFEIEQLRPDLPAMVTRTSESGRVLVRDTRFPEPAFAEIFQPTSGMTTFITRRPLPTEEVTTRHTCVSCGKFRSPSYEHRHPVAPGELAKSSICRKCTTIETSSEESSDGHRRSRRSVDYYRLRRRWTTSTGDRVSEFERGRPRHLERRRPRNHSSRRSSHHEPPRVTITYDGARSRRSTSEYSSPERRGTRLVRRIQYIDSHGRTVSRSRSRSRSTTLSRRHYRRDDSSEEPSSSEDDRVAIRFRHVPSRSISRSATYRRPLVRIRSRDPSGFGSDYEHVYTTTEERVPRHVERVVEVEDDLASFQPTMCRQSESMLVQPGTTYTTSRAGDIGLESSYPERPVEVRSHTERLQHPPSRSVRVVQVSSETQDAFRRNRVNQIIETPKVIYESRPPPIITRHVVEPAIQSVTETTVIEPRAAPITETHVVERRERASTPISETHVVERRGRSPTPVRERHVIERRRRSPSRVYKRHVETRSGTRASVVDGEMTETRTSTSSPVYGTHITETRRPRGYEGRRRVKIADRHRSRDTSDEYSPPGKLACHPFCSTLADNLKDATGVFTREEAQALIGVFVALSQSTPKPKSVISIARLKQLMWSRHRHSTTAGQVVLIEDADEAHLAAGAMTGTTTGTLLGNCATWLVLYLHGSRNKSKETDTQSIGLPRDGYNKRDRLAPGHWKGKRVGRTFRKGIVAGDFRYGKSSFTHFTIPDCSFSSRKQRPFITCSLFTAEVT